MIKLHAGPVLWKGGRPVAAEDSGAIRADGVAKTIAGDILRAHNSAPDPARLELRFDRLISHDITYVGIIQTAKASGLKRFPVPYVLTNCHNSLCAVGGTINEDDHAFGLSAAVKYGGIYVPANQAVIHQYAREKMAACGDMILGSDSHTRYGALGTMGVGEGGPEIVKQLLGGTYGLPAPRIVLVWLEGEPVRGVGPHDVAIALCGAVYKNNFVKNSILEFAGPGVSKLPMDFRIGIDVMTTETACLSSIWATDGRVEEYLAAHGRSDAYRSLAPGEGAYYDAMITVDLSKAEPMAALPFHPSEACTIRALSENAGDILRETEKRAAELLGDQAALTLTDKLEKGKIRVDQGIIAGCAGGMYDNIAEAAAILEGRGVGSGAFSLSVYPSSTPINLALIQNGIQQKLMTAGALFKPCFCGPCFGAGDVPRNNGLSIRHTTRNFANREGSKPGEGQISAVMLMDARSIAATARNGGLLTAATDIDYTSAPDHPYIFMGEAYGDRIYDGFGNPKPETPLALGPNIAEWPQIPALPENLLLKLSAVIFDPVTTTDELIPSGETSSYRSNPLRLAEFTLSRREPDYVARCKAIQALERGRAAGKPDPELTAVLEAAGYGAEVLAETGVGSALFACRPGDGSAREQAASCQRVLGGAANIAYDYATKRYRSNCVNWGMLPFTVNESEGFGLSVGDWLFIPGIRETLLAGGDRVEAVAVSQNGAKAMTLNLPGLAPAEREIILDGCLMNWYAAQSKEDQGV